jgi:putative alpha-1,2-mannosidase
MNRTTQHIIIAFATALLLAPLAVNSAEVKRGPQRQPVDWVDCTIGTHDERWMTFPGAALPFGMVKLSPLTRLGERGEMFWKGGYEYMIPSIAGFNNIHEIGSPLFDRAVIDLDPRYYPGKTFTIETCNNAPANAYIQSATLNGKPWSKPWLFAVQIQQGGCLTMGPEPNKHWGAGVANAPPAAD